jgi:hypothetical protein
LSDPGKRRLWGEANRTRVRTEFAVEQMVERHLQIIRADLPENALVAVGSVRRREEPGLS